MCPQPFAHPRNWFKISDVAAETNGPKLGFKKMHLIYDFTLILSFVEHKTQ